MLSAIFSSNAECNVMHAFWETMLVFLVIFQCTFFSFQNCEFFCLPFNTRMASKFATFLQRLKCFFGNTLYYTRNILFKMLLRKSYFYGLQFSFPIFCYYGCPKIERTNKKSLFPCKSYISLLMYKIQLASSFHFF